MIFLYIFLFLNLVTADSNLVDGWIDNKGPKIGGVYWTKRRFVDEPLDAKGKRIGCIVLYKLKPGDPDNNEYLITLMDQPKDYDRHPPGAFLATEFFGLEQTLIRDKKRISVRNYHIYPYKTRVIEADATKMKLYRPREDILIMNGEDLGRLVLACQLMDGWPPTWHNGPLLYHIYWIRQEDLGINLGKSGYYLPCVVFRRLLDKHQQPTNKYQVVMMSKLWFIDDRLGQVATEFFAHDDQFGLPLIDTLNYLKYYRIFPGEYFEVEGRPDIMRIWGGRVMGMTPFNMIGNSNETSGPRQTEAIENLLRRGGLGGKALAPMHA